jgi:hypothetical protein
MIWKETKIRMTDHVVTPTNPSTSKLKLNQFHLSQYTCKFPVHIQVRSKLNFVFYIYIKYLFRF